MVAYLAKGLADSGVCSVASLLLLLPVSAAAAAAGEAGLCIAPLVPHLLGVPLGVLLLLGLLPAAAVEPAASVCPAVPAAAAAATGTGMMLPLGLHRSWKVTVLPTEGDATCRTCTSSSSESHACVRDSKSASDARQGSICLQQKVKKSCPHTAAEHQAEYTQQCWQNLQ
jgi:hypothetical protein